MSRYLHADLLLRLVVVLSLFYCLPFSCFSPLSFPICPFLHTPIDIPPCSSLLRYATASNHCLLRYFEMVCSVLVFPSALVFNTTTFSLSAFVGNVARGIPRASFTWFLVLVLVVGCCNGEASGCSVAGAARETLVFYCYILGLGPLLLTGPVLFVYASVSLDLILFLYVW
ncbi:hypothetical protein DVH24_003699 [Malus domestica]|uniref:Uncharacterized protein n=1 Tax=Malus domestica TaxID=3750 RepID=A0A498INZ4_MALDO|nr:hypothetical protein DVH24_003699 [Malus domestica]